MAFEDWDKLLYGIQKGECTLFLGPSIPVEHASGPRIPRAALAERLLARLGPESRRSLDASNLAHVTQRFLVEEDEVELEMELEKWNAELGACRTPLHDDLAALPFQRIVTSSHDGLMESALRGAGKEPVVERYHYRGSNPELLPEPSTGAPLVFHLYGRVSEPPSLVLTETQLLDFLAALISKTPPLPNDLNAALKNGRMFLFLGFGLEQWYLRILLHVLKVLKRSSLAFVADALDQDARGQHADAVLFYSDNFKRMAVYDEDLSSFVSGLRSRYRPLDEGPRGTTPASPSPAVARAGGARVFVCHASEDAATAREVHDTLARYDLDPWLDKEDLRGGDRWDDLIESTISEVDYVVVLNSRTLAAKAEGRAYVNKEIKAALRAAELSWNAFVIPVLTDDQPLLPQLEKLHSVDLREPNGLQKLVREIKRHAGAV